MAHPKRATKAELRQFAGVSQVDLASRLDKHQSALSRFERAKTAGLKALARYVAELGGTVEIRVRLGGEEFVLVDAPAVDLAAVAHAKLAQQAHGELKQIELAVFHLRKDALAKFKEALALLPTARYSQPDPDAVAHLLRKSGLWTDAGVTKAFRRYAYFVQHGRRMAEG